MRIALGLPALGHTWPAKRGDVVLISAEGRGLPQRLRGWCIRHMPGESYSNVLARAQLYCIEQPINLSDQGSAHGLVSAVDQLGIEPVCIIVDTMSRNSDGKIENSTTDAAAYLSIIDIGLRARYRCSVILTHHVGHVDKGRIRGPIVLAANTDTLIRIERPDASQRVATMTVDRMKDSEPPAPVGLKGDVVDLGQVDEDGQPLTTLALSATEAAAAPSTAGVKQPQGKAQRQLLMALRAQEGAPVWTIADLREVGRKAGMPKGTARSAAEALTLSTHMTPAVGGWKLANA